MRCSGVATSCPIIALARARERDGEARVRARGHDIRQLPNETASRHGAGSRAGQAALALRHQNGHEHGTVTCLRHLAEGAAGEGQPDRSVRLFAAAEALQEARRVLVQPNDLSGYSREAAQPLLAAQRAALGEQAFAAAWTAGRALPLDEAVAEALAEAT